MSLPGDWSLISSMTCEDCPFDVIILHRSKSQLKSINYVTIIIGAWNQ